MFKKGDLVEVIGSVSFPELIGERFTLSTKDTAAMCAIEDFKLREGEFWLSPFRNPLDHDLTISFKSEHLRKVNPDGDELSSDSFDAIMKSLKSKSNIVNVKLTLEK